MVKTTAQISTDAPGTVISTDPAGSALVKKGDTVTLHRGRAVRRWPCRPGSPARR